MCYLSGVSAELVLELPQKQQRHSLSADNLDGIPERYPAHLWT